MAERISVVERPVDRVSSFPPYAQGLIGNSRLAPCGFLFGPLGGVRLQTRRQAMRRLLPRNISIDEAFGSQCPQLRALGISGRPRLPSHRVRRRRSGANDRRPGLLEVG